MPSNDTPTLQYARISDFSPGIRHNTRRVGGDVSPQQNQLGVADAADTYRCIALPNGGLGPLPRRTYTLTRAGLETNFQTRVQGGKFHIVGFHVSGPVTASGASGGQSRVEFHHAYEYFHDVDNNGSFETRKWRWERTRIWEASPTVETVKSVSTTTEQTPQAYRGAYFVDYRAHPTDPTQVGYPLVACGWYAGDGGGDEVWAVFPDPAALTTLGVANISTTIALDRLVQHQGRLIGFENVPIAHGPGSALWISDEQVWWTNVNRTTLSNTIASMLSQGAMTGYGAVATVSAQELIAIKQRGGAISIHGDIDDPTIIALPGVVATAGAKVIPVYSPLGLIYGVKHGGVYAWQGGDSSQLLSRDLEDDFWRISDTDILSYDGQFECWSEWVVCPNNWLLDTTTGAWWLLDDPGDVPILGWQVDPDEGRYLYGHPVTFGDAGGGATPVAYGWDRFNPAYSYRWKSQALEFSLDRVVNIEEIIISVIGNGDTVTVTLSNEVGDVADEVFTIVSSNMPKRYKQRTRLTGSGIKVQIDADGGADAAPIVFEVVLGWSESQHLANNG